MGRDTTEYDDEWNSADPDTIMIPNSQSSPTTGAISCVNVKEDSLSSNHQPGRGHHSSLPYFDGLQNQDGRNAYMKQQQQLLDFDIQTDIASMDIGRVCLDADFTSCTNMNKIFNGLMSNLPEDNTISQVDSGIEDDTRVYSSLNEMAKVADDGYNWRKYGQKQVKGSESPRSYYKCTNPTCAARKKVEQAYNGNLTQIIYKGRHNHPKPNPNRGLPHGSTFVHDETNIGEANSYIDEFEGLDTELAEQLSIASPFGPEKYFNEEVSSPLHRQNVDDEDIDDNDSKRRRTDDCMVEPNISSRGFCEDKIMVQAESVIDIIDDGYRWRKYGQKVVKGNPNPRSYYKCTSANCSVRKHVERNPQNIKDVITTYEGKHNHEVPPAKNGYSLNKNVGHLPPVPFAGQASPIPLTRSSTLPKVEMQDHFSHHFRTTSFLANEFLSPGLIDHFGTAMNFGASSGYHSDFPMPNGLLGLNMSNLDIPQVCITSSHVSDLVNQPLSTLPGLLSSNMSPDFNMGQGCFRQSAHHPGHDFDGGTPKQEKLDNITDDSSVSEVTPNEPSSVPPHYGLVL